MELPTSCAPPCDLPEEEDDNDAASVVAVEASRGVGVSESRSFSFEVRTQEGDVATLQLQRSTSASYSGQLIAGEGTLTRSESLELERQSSLDYTIVGDLNEEERGAIDELLEKVDGVADRFFDGNVQAALEYSLEFGFDEAEIAGFSLNLSRSVEYYAASSYQVVQTLGPEEDPAAATRPAEEDLQAAGDLANGLRDLTTAPRLNLFFADTGDLVTQAFRGATATDPRLDPADDPIWTLIERLLDWVQPAG